LIQISPNPSHQPRKVRQAVIARRRVVAKEVETIIWITNVHHTAGEIEMIGIDIVVLVVDVGADPVQGLVQDHPIIIVREDQEAAVVVIIIHHGQLVYHRVCPNQYRVIIY